MTHFGGFFVQEVVHVITCTNIPFTENIKRNESVSLGHMYWPLNTPSGPFYLTAIIYLAPTGLNLRGVFCVQCQKSTRDFVWSSPCALSGVEWQNGRDNFLRYTTFFHLFHYTDSFIFQVSLLRKIKSFERKRKNY